MSQVREVIGTYTLKEDTVFRNTYECAAWYENVLVKAGTYDVTTDGYWQFVKLPGVVTDDFFQSLYGGCRIGEPYDCKQNAGKESVHFIQTQDYLTKDDPQYNIKELA